MKKIELIYSYIANNRIRLEQDVDQLQSNIRFRRVGITDCVELACAIQRLETFKEVSGHIVSLLGTKKAGE
ncbi:MAG: hypothetical protein IJ645_07180 [Ruminococcus sp.]|nr:hypothetical protein [Ruminococcus sp.]